MKRETVTINGTVYDKHTGMPLGKEESHTKKHTVVAPRQHSLAVHRTPQRSTTLDRRYVKKKTTMSDIQRVAVQSQKTAVTPKLATQPTSSHKIERFARQPVAAPAIKTPMVSADLAPAAHPLAVRAQEKLATKKQASTVPKPSHIIKQEAMTEAMERTVAAPRTNRAKHSKVEKKRSKTSRFMRFATAGATLALLGGYFTYINMPNLSVRVAAAQSGVNASYPNYSPSGYSASGPVAVEKGAVKVAFKQNGGNQNFTISQENSGWDSSAVLDNYVQPKTGNNYTVNRDGGLTVYTFDGNAAWVNKGVLYKIEGNTYLAPEQIVKIATSM